MCSCFSFRCSTRCSVQVSALWDHCTASAWPRPVWPSDPCVRSKMNGYTRFPTTACKCFNSLNMLPSAVFTLWTLQENIFQFLITPPPKKKQEVQSTLNPVGGRLHRLFLQRKADHDCLLLQLKRSFSPPFWFLAWNVQHSQGDQSMLGELSWHQGSILWAWIRET